MSYLAISPTVFYQCPAVLDDLSRVLAIRATVSFASAHPGIASKQRGTMLGEVVYESDAHVYIEEGLKTAELQQDDRDALLVIARMFSERRAGLDDLVERIATVGSTDVQAVARNIPFDTSVDTLLLTHSAFASLFPSPMPLREEPEEAFLTGHLLYSRVRDSIPRQTLIHDISAYYALENL